MNIVEFTSLISGFFGCISIISFAFYFGHSDLGTYKNHGLKVLSSLFVIYLSCYSLHGSVTLMVIPLLFFHLSPLLFKYDYYGNLIQQDFFITKNYLLSYLVVLSILLVCFWIFSINNIWLLISYGVIPFHVFILTVSAWRNRKSFLSNSDVFLPIKLSLAFELIFFLFIYFIIVTGNGEKYIILLVSLSLIHLFLLGLGLAPRVIHYLALQRLNRANEIFLKKKNLQDLKKNIELEQKVNIAAYYSKLAALDPEFSIYVLDSIKSNLNNNIDKSSLTLTKLARHMRNHVSFTNTMYSSLREELKNIDDYISLCKLLFHENVIQITTTVSTQPSDLFIKSQLLFPQLKNIVKSISRLDQKATILLQLTEHKEELEVDISIKSELNISLDKEKIGLGLLQSRMLDSGIVSGRINSITAQKLHFFLQISKEA